MTNRLVLNSHNSTNDLRARRDLPLTESRTCTCLARLLFGKENVKASRLGQARGHNQGGDGAYDAIIVLR